MLDSFGGSLLQDYFQERRLRGASEISLVMPLGAPIPPSPAASQALLADGEEIPFDLFLGVPVHHAPAVVYAVGDVTSVGTPKAESSHERQASERPVRRAFRPAIGGQGRLRDQPHPALVRP